MMVKFIKSNLKAPNIKAHKPSLKASSMPSDTTASPGPLAPGSAIASGAFGKLKQPKLKLKLIRPGIR